MIKINVVMDYWKIGGAENGYKRIATKLSHYDWVFSTTVDPTSDLVIYSNNYKFFNQARKFNIKNIIFRYTGPRSHNIKIPEDISAIICSSKKSFDLCTSNKKILIYNGVDFEYLKTIKPIFCDCLYSPARIGIGQCVEEAIIWAQQNNIHLTVLGGKQHVQENTYDYLKLKYKSVNWVGLVDPEIALAYMKGCKIYICPTKNHGVSNAILEAVALDKPIINLGGVEIPSKENIDIRLTSKKYDDLIKSVIKI